MGYINMVFYLLSVHSGLTLGSILLHLRRNSEAPLIYDYPGTREGEETSVAGSNLFLYSRPPREGLVMFLSNRTSFV